MIYLDNAATSRFKPKCMFDAMFCQLGDSANPGRGGHNDSLDCAIKINDTRATLKALVGADDDYHLVFTSGCTEALNLAIFGYLADNIGGNVVTTVFEHNSVLRPLNNLLSRKVIDEIRYVSPSDPSQCVTAEDIAKLTDKDTRLIVVNHVSNVTGATADAERIGELAKSLNVPFLVDSAQSLGHKRIDVKNCNISMLAAAGHKGLHGSQGTGFLVFRKDMRIRPIRFGGTGTFSDSLIQPEDAPEGLESGTMNTAGIIGLGASAKWTYDNFEKINSHINYLASQALYGLSKIDKIKVYTKTLSGVISFNVKDVDSSEVADFLNDNEIAVRNGLHCAPLAHRFLGTEKQGTVRMSIDYNNNAYHISRILDVLEKFCKFTHP